MMANMRYQHMSSVIPIPFDLNAGELWITTVERMKWKVDSKMIENEVNEDYDEVFDSFGVQY